MSTEPMPRKAECILRGAIGILLFFAGLDKILMGLESFVAKTSVSFVDTWLPAGIVSIFLLILPVLEILLGIWLLLGWKRQWALFIVGHLFVIFMFGHMILGDSELVVHDLLYIIPIALALMLPSGCPFTGDPQ